MSVIHINNFGGEVPRVLPRDLPAGNAQVNSNLLATSTEFRPVLGNLRIPGPVPEQNNKTLYRNQRNADGSLISDLSQGWVCSVDDLSIVRGQVMDDTTERTYYAYNDGSKPPFVRNNLGVQVTLGIPPPPKPSVSLLTTEKITREKVQVWRDTKLIPDIHQAISDCSVTDQVTARFTTTGDIAEATIGTYLGSARAGITKWVEQTPATAFQYFPTVNGSGQLSQRGVYEPWNVLIRVPEALAQPEGILNPQLNGITANGAVWLGFPALPLWGVLDADALSAKLTDFVQPNGQPLWTEKQVQAQVVALSSLLSPNYYLDVKNKRAQLDSCYLDYANNGYRLLLNYQRPVILPSEAQADFDTRLAKWVNLNSSAVTAMVSATAKGWQLSHEIESIYASLHDRLLSAITTYLGNIPIEKTSDDFDGLAVMDESALVDTRFYVTTYVTDFGEESAPSEPSQKIDVAQNDLAVIAEPSRADVETGRNITKWRIYRSNAGTSAASFQFVKEVTFGTVPTVALPTFSGSVGVDIPGFGDKDKWRDIVATWLIYRERGLISPQDGVDAFLDTSKLAIGDSIQQHRVIGGVIEYQVKKTWNGSAWVMQAVPDLESVYGKTVHVDGLASSSLGEVLQTTTWAPPPYRFDTSVTPLPRIPATKGVNPYLRGLVGMSNGVMAGFVDNFVAFSEPYIAYAWPVEYQIPLQFPVVGLCAFGQSLLVGTKGNPYLISGTDSASMSERKLNQSQSCVSARSMVAAMGGVFYASPDGYCFANESGAEVATQGLFSGEEWKALDPASIFAVVHDSVLYFWYTGNGGGCYGLDMVARKLVRMSTETNMGSASFMATAAFEDVVTDGVYVTYGREVRQLFAGPRTQGRWKSGKITFAKQEPLAWVRVLSDFNNGPVTVNWYGDGQLRKTRVLTSKEPQRLPGGKYLEHEVEVISGERVSVVTLASTTEELKES